MYTLTFLFGGVLAISFLNSPTLGGGWTWDAGNALGFAAFAGMLYLSMPGGARRDVRTHEWFGHTVLAIALLHGLWFLLADGAAVEYIKPGAPVYMWTGIGGFVLLVVLVIFAVMPTRVSIHKTYTRFRNWHQVLAVIGIASVIHHIIASGFYLQAWYQAVLLILFTAVALFGRGIRRRASQSPGVTPPNLLVIGVLGAAVFVIIRNLSP